MYLYILLLLMAFIVYYVVAASTYRRTDYYKTTHKSFFAMRFNTGNYGEYLTYRYLRGYETDGARFLYNCYLPKDNGETTEIDVLMIHTSGIYVFESKNYSGWIFGSERQKNWTQTLPNGRKARKEHFLNPIMQNKLHIKWLKNQVGEDIPIHSVIVFSERCTLKKIDLTGTDHYVIKRDVLSRTVKHIHSQENGALSKDKVDEIYAKLYPFTQVTDEQKEQHIQNIVEADRMNKKPESGKVASDTGEMLTCPRCGGKLVLRTAKKGAQAGNQFYGCTNFPKCRYVQK